MVLFIQQPVPERELDDLVKRVTCVQPAWPFILSRALDSAIIFHNTASAFF